MSHLSPCETCSRHIRCVDETCPFCGAASTRRRPVPPSPGRLGRAALFAFGTAVAVSLGGCNCGASHTPGDGGSGDDASVEVDAGADAGTDASALDDAGGFDAGFDAGPVAPPYGTPPEDAGGPGLLYGGAPGD